MSLCIQKRCGGTVRLILLFTACGAVAADDLFITVSRPMEPIAEEAAPVVVEPVSNSSLAVPAVDSDKPKKEVVPSASNSNVSPESTSPLIKKETQAPEKWDRKPLRDPFWPVGYFPENWQLAKVGTDGTAESVSDWDAPAKLIRVNGTSRMGDQTAAIINGEVKSAGDLIEIHYSGRIYQWKILDVQSSGKVQLERFSVKSAGSDLK